MSGAAGDRPYLVTLGETLAVLAAPDPGPLAVGTGLRLGLAGAESNVAIGVSRLGGAATWIGRVGADAFGDLVLRELRAEGVTALAVRDPAPTALLVRERRTAVHSRTRYYRAGMAGSRLGPQDVPEDVVARAAALHVTGITAALGDGPARAVRRAVDIAAGAGVPVSLDVNHRSLLWSEQEARSALLPLLRRSDLVFAGTHEAVTVLGGAPAEPAAQPAAELAEVLAGELCALGPAGAVIKLGADGAYALLDGTAYRQHAAPVRVHDSVGAGDAFVAGYLAELLAGGPPERRLRTAALLGAFAVGTTGDWEGLPRRAELDLFAHADGDVR